ncbi:MAG: dethiobiotin synthase [Glaciecola sp.]
MRTYFVTGTDTDVGKTIATKLMVLELNDIAGDTLAIKPISAGCEMTDDGLRNSDALILQQASAIKADYEVINPIAFAQPIAPHIAAAEQGVEISLHDLQNALEQARKLNPRWLMIEGAGGWRLPLNNNRQYFSDFALQNQMKVIMVVGMKLGCLNHAALTYQAIKQDGLQCVGWVANQLSSDMPYYQENIASLTSMLTCPMLAEIPFQPGNEASITKINCSDSFLTVFR